MPPRSLRPSAPLRIFIAAIAASAGVAALLTASPEPQADEALLRAAIEASTARLVGLSDAIPGASESARAALLREAEEVLRDREEALLPLLEIRPETLREAALPERATRFLPADLLARVETEETVSGLYAAIIADDLEQGRATMQHFLDVPGRGRLRLFLLEEVRGWPIGAELEVRGTRLRDRIVAADRDISVVSAPAAGTTALAAPQSRRVAVILFNFRNNTAQPWSVESARGIAFTGSTSASAYYAEASAGVLTMTGDVFGWFTIPYDNVNCGSDYPAWSAAARSAAQAAGADLSSYTNIQYAFPSTSGCPGTGWANVGGPESWLDGAFYTRLVAHELGHNYGTRHASSWSCVDGLGVRVPLSGLCSRSEYGDPFDVMGGSTNHFNNFHKGQAGWLVSSNTQTVTADGLYTIAPIEGATSAVQSLRVPRGGGEYFYLEYRRPYGLFDNFTLTSPVVNGVSVRLAPDYPTLTQSLLLDMVPLTTSYGDAPLPVGGFFSDAVSGASVTVISAGATAATVDVRLGAAACARGVPGIAIAPSSQWGAAGVGLTYNVTLWNNDASTCPPSPFTVTSSLPAGWSQSPDPWTVSLAPGASVTRAITVASGLTTPGGLYTFGQRVSNDNAPAFAASTTAALNVLPPDTTPPVVTIVTPSNGEIIQGGYTWVEAAAEDASGIGRIEIRVDGVSLAMCSGVTSCRARWWTGAVPPGQHVIQAIASDRAVPPRYAFTWIAVTRP